MKKPRNYGLSTVKTASLIRISDAFRRHAAFSKPEVIAELVDQAAKLQKVATWYCGEYGDGHDLNTSVAHALKNETKKLTGIAEQLGIDTLELPIAKKSPLGAFFNRAVLKGLETKVKVALQTKVYADDLSQLGPIDPEIDTPLDRGLRGLAMIDDKIKLSW